MTKTKATIEEEIDYLWESGLIVAKSPLYPSIRKIIESVRDEVEGEYDNEIYEKDANKFTAEGWNMREDEVHQKFNEILKSIEG